jgi:hypothetical protein
VRRLLDVRSGDAAVHGVHNLASRDERAHLTNSPLGRWDERLPAPAWVDVEDKDELEFVEERLDGRDRRVPG